MKYSVDYPIFVVWFQKISILAQEGGGGRGEEGLKQKTFHGEVWMFSSAAYPMWHLFKEFRIT